MNIYIYEQIISLYTYIYLAVIWLLKKLLSFLSFSIFV